MSGKKDYLALCVMGSMSFFGRSANPEKAIGKCREALYSDYPGAKADLDGRLVTFQLVDVTDHDGIGWDDSGVFPLDSPENKLKPDPVKVFL